ncbi:hypothetical protein FACS1894176_04790 [Bacteroidia bacterium]|nr:hypothetical protein FACS1894176_04790 [Bacteroidia bacterium]
MEKAEEQVKEPAEQLRETVNQETQETVTWNLEPSQEGMAEQTEEVQEGMTEPQEMTKTRESLPIFQGSIPMMTQNLMTF